MPDTTPPLDALAVVQGYHQRSKHALNAYAAGPETLDWDAQPDPFRRYAGAPLTALPLPAEGVATPWSALFAPGAVPTRSLGLDSLGLLFELSFALSAWKQSGPDRWAVRINPSSGNLHPTEAWLIATGVAGLADGLHHYAPREHALEQRARLAAPVAGSARAWVGLSSIHWREAWKYGERAFRYCQLDTGHAVGALRYAAAVCGWQLRPVAADSATLAHALGLDRTDDFRNAEHEEPELLFELVARSDAAPADPPWAALDSAHWQGLPNRLDAHPMYRWPVMDEVARASREPAAASTTSARPAAAASETASETPRPGASLPAAQLIRQRRSAQRFDRRASLPLAALWPLLQALHPSRLPFDAGPVQPQVHVLLFAHRVDGLAPGAYLLPRSEAGQALLRSQLPAALNWAPVPGGPADARLWRLAENPALAGTLRTLNCHQALGSDAILGFALLAEFNPLATPAAYRARLQEAGLIGQVLYLEAEAMGLRGTGIGCFFDDALHELIGLPETGAGQAALQSVYHFTVGLPVVDERIATEAPYAHLPTAPLPSQEPTP